MNIRLKGSDYSMIQNLCVSIRSLYAASRYRSLGVFPHSSFNDESNGVFGSIAGNASCSSFFVVYSVVCPVNQERRSKFMNGELGTSVKFIWWYGNLQ